MTVVVKPHGHYLGRGAWCQELNLTPLIILVGQLDVAERLALNDLNGLGIQYPVFDFTIN